MVRRKVIRLVGGLLRMTDRLSAPVIGLVLRPGLAFLLLVSATATAGHGQQFDPPVPHPAFLAGNGPRVLFDSAHFNFDTQFSAFFELLRKDGFRMSFQKERWTPASLEQADLVVISGPLAVSRDSLIAKGVDHYWWSDEGRQDAFTSDEILVLMRWIRGGGNLLLIVDHAPSAAAARRLLEALGVDARNSMTWDAGRRPPGYNETDNRRASKILFSREHGSIGEHPILQGRNEKERIDRVATYVGSSLVGPLESSPLLLLSRESFDYWKNPPERGGAEHRVSAAGRAQAVAFSLDTGRVVVVAEYTPFQARWGGSGDPDGKIGAGMAYAGAQDQQFVTNIMRWLVRVIP